MARDPRRDADGIGRAVAVLVALGIVLGLGFNALGRAGKPPRGLAWIAAPMVLETLEESGKRGMGSPPPVSDDPLAVSGGGAADGAAGLPAIPDLGRPIQIQLTAVKQFFDARGALFVDAREKAEYAAGHVPGAVNLPFDESVTDPGGLEKLDTGGRPIITYCGGGTCEVAIQLAATLIQYGHSKVLVFIGGYPEWQGAGYPVAKGGAAAGGNR